MRTTIDLPDSLFQSIKLLALQRKISLKSFIIKALNDNLKEELDSASARMEKPPITRVEGVIPALSNRQIAELLDSENEGKAR